jgi:hypothetical protein
MLLLIVFVFIELEVVSLLYFNSNVESVFLVFLEVFSEGLSKIFSDG